MNRTFDAVVVGAGYVGCSVAYHLSAAGLKTALIDQGPIGAGASRANFGNIQVQDAELDHSLQMIKSASTRFDDLEEQLGYDFNYRKIGGLLLITNESQWRSMELRQEKLKSVGIITELIPSERIPEVEPLLEPRSVLGALYHPHEGQVYPFTFMNAHVQKAKQYGLAVHTYTEVLDFIIDGERIKGVKTSNGDFSVGTVVLTTGAWTKRLGEKLGRKWSVHHVHGQAIATEPTELLIRNHLSSAAFFEDSHVDTDQEEEETSAVMAVSQSPHGHFMLGESSSPDERFCSHSTVDGQKAIVREIIQYLPTTEKLRIIRGWGAAVAFTDDGRPFLGPVNGMQGLILATAFRSTVISTPIAGETVAQLVTQGRSDLDISKFSPDREITHAS